MAAFKSIKNFVIGVYALFLSCIFNIKFVAINTPKTTYNNKRMLTSTLGQILFCRVFGLSAALNKI